MKNKMILICALVCTELSIKVNASHDIGLTTNANSRPDTIPSIISNMNFAYYHSKPVDSLLNHLPVGIVDMKIRGWHNLRRADVLYVNYPNNVFVAIHVKDFVFMNPNGSGNNPPHINWDINLFKKEKINYVVAFNGSQCINGCQYKYK
jgi:hypothetical protein